MSKQIILYNLAPHVTDEQYKEYVKKETRKKDYKM